MRRSHLCAATGTGFAAAVLALAVAGPAAANSAGRAALNHSASPAAARTPSVGSVPAGSQISFEVDLKLPDPQGAAAFAQAVSTPGSTKYRQFLTAAQWEARFSPSPSDVTQVKAFLSQAGFQVGQASADRMAVAATGTAAQVERAFATTLSLHRVHGQALRLADSDLSVPSSVAGVIGGVTGVNQVLAQPDDTTGNASATKPDTQSGKIPQPPGFRVASPCGSFYDQQFDTTLPAYGNGYPSSPPWAVCGYTGPQLRSAYGLTDSDTGSGVTVAIVDAYASPTLLSDAQTFVAKNDPSNPLASSQFSELVPNSFTDQNKCGASGWFGEQSLDVEAVHDMAPGANILFAGAQSCTTPALNAALRAVVDSGRAQVITNSYGDTAGDLLDSASDRQSTDDILEMAAGTGVSVLFSSGDGGDEYTTVGQVAADYPASSPYATAVGGTTLQIGRDGQRIGEYGWSTARSFQCNSTYAQLGGCTSTQVGQWLPIDEALDGGSGGGTSVVYPQPYWQAGVVPSSLSEVNGSTPMRVVPDISMEADPATGMLVGETQTFPDGTYYDQYRIGGTSVASPLFAGLLARAIQTGGGTPFGLVNPALYSLSRNSSAIDDIGPAGLQDQSRADYANSIDSSQGYLYTTRIIDYEGTEQYCTSHQGKGNHPPVCTQRQVALNTASGYDNMTGLGSPGTRLVATLAAIK